MYIWMENHLCLSLSFILEWQNTSDSISDPCPRVTQAPEDMLDSHAADVQKQQSRSWVRSRFYTWASDVHSHKPSVCGDALGVKKKQNSNETHAIHWIQQINTVYLDLRNKLQLKITSAKFSLDSVEGFNRLPGLHL